MNTLGMPNWSLLTTYLGRIPDSVTLTLPELAVIVGGLPLSAYKHRAWWSGDRTHVNSWKSAGFTTSNLQMGSQVTFERSELNHKMTLKTKSHALPSRKLQNQTSVAIGNNEVENRVAELISDFDLCLDVYDHEVPFTRSGQYSHHRKTIDMRRSFPSVGDALKDEDFLDSFRKTLFAWGIGKRGSRLVPLTEFGDHLRVCSDEIALFEHLRLDDSELDVDAVAKALWQLIGKLKVVDNKSLIVPGSKTLHHLLPDLVPPMDRAWTGAFFLWSMSSTKYEERIFIKTLTTFSKIAQASKASQYVGHDWRTSPTKVLDNAIIGYCKLHNIEARGS